MHARSHTPARLHRTPPRAVALERQDFTAARRHSRRGVLGLASLLGAGVAGAAAATVGGTAHADAAAPAPAGRGGGAPGSEGPEALLRRWAADTWRSLDAMTHPDTGLAADNIGADLQTRSGYTSPTNIGGLLWSTLVARELDLITPGESRRRIARTLKTLQRMKRHEPSGMYVNWYDEADGSILRSWPGSGDVVVPFVSSVDMGWLGAALHLVAQADPSNARIARALFDAMRWDVFWDREVAAQPGQVVGGFWLEDPSREGVVRAVPWNGVGGPEVWYHATHHYDTAVSEARMVTYLGIMTGQFPAGAYFTTFRTFPPDWDWPEMAPVGEWATYEGVDVFEGAHEYRGFRVVPGWGGSMFEELMPDLFVPEAEWAPDSWGVNHPLHVRAQREHGLDEAGYGYWGFSPSSDPHAGYREYGVDALGLNPTGYFSDAAVTDWVAGQEYPQGLDGVVTPHAAFLAMQYEREAAIENLSRIESELGAYGPGGFHDAVATGTGVRAERHLSLDQSMIMGALGNVLLDGALHRWFATSEVEQSLRPVIGQERFAAGE
ncbi:glucoamylase family protein [Brachybacterium sp. J153]|uniref:glucoamylase family protein n=1 Tax=Brachybacterium sp. J153 TaxID=3116488 RepID=UPI002E770D9E|nr:glucoamylase family protein [Brachybacterium sp. J153]MEE1618357.1 glucoamylase family protein [Brachybacterium sp. J153]